MPHNTYVAMGSSFAAGPGLKPRAADSPRAAGRSASNYAHLVAGRLGLALADVTFSGATTAHILGPDDRGTPAQLDAVTAETRLVTITAGGNDVGYLPGLTLSSFPAFAAGLPFVRRGLAAATDAAAADAKFATLESNAARIIAEIRSRAPGCRVLFVDYLTILPPEGVDTSPLPAATAAWGRALAARLSETIARVAAGEGAEVVLASEASAVHHAWAPEPWTRRFHLSLRGGAPYHPDLAGMAAVADLVTAQLALPWADAS
jgi:lysophospholipase L1-like esterase